MKAIEETLDLLRDAEDLVAPWSPSIGSHAVRRIREAIEKLEPLLTQDLGEGASSGVVAFNTYRVTHPDGTEGHETVLQGRIQAALPLNRWR